MTDEQIFELAETCEFDRHHSKITLTTYWECDEIDLLRFARALWAEGFKVGYHEGWSDCRDHYD